MPTESQYNLRPLEDARRLQRLTLRQMAQDLPFSFGYIGHLLRGVSSREENLKILAKYLHVPWSVVANGKERKRA